jgi:hypothetical protein
MRGGYFKATALFKEGSKGREIATVGLKPSFAITDLLYDLGLLLNKVVITRQCPLALP